MGFADVVRPMEMGWGTADGQAAAKVRTLISRIIQPAIRRNLGWTRTLLGEALYGASRAANGHAKAQLADRIFEYVRGRMRYVNDPTGRDMFTELPVAWSRKMGDCDDFAALLAALFMAAGLRVRLRIIQSPRSEGWNHIFPQVEIAGAWRTYDATLPAYTRPGTEAPHKRFKDFEVNP